MNSFSVLTGTLAFTVRNSGVRAISATGMTSLAL
jgi:hypothetical protein